MIALTALLVVGLIVTAIYVMLKPGYTYMPDDRQWDGFENDKEHRG